MSGPHAPEVFERWEAAGLNPAVLYLRSEVRALSWNCSVQSLTYAFSGSNSVRSGFPDMQANHFLISTWPFLN